MKKVVYKPVSHSEQGFTLVELMIVLVIVSILFAVVVPSYQNQIMRTDRTAATGCLLEASQSLERRYASASSYAGSLPTLGCQTDLADSYTFSATIVTQSYTLKATPKKDTQCGTLTYTSAGAKGVVANGSVTGTVDACW